MQATSEIEDEADRKKINESVSKLESGGKIVIINSVLKLIAPTAQCEEEPLMFVNQVQRIR
jgi:hypothetical protein